MFLNKNLDIVYNDVYLAFLRGVVGKRLWSNNFLLLSAAGIASACGSGSSSGGVVEPVLIPSSVSGEEFRFSTVQAANTEFADLEVDLSQADLPQPLAVIGMGGTFEQDIFGTEVINLTGGRGDDTFTGNSRGNRLNGRAGDDVLDGGAGDDVLEGGTGNDTFVVSSGTDIVTDFNSVQDKLSFTNFPHIVQDDDLSFSSHRGFLRIAFASSEDGMEDSAILLNSIVANSSNLANLETEIRAVTELGEPPAIIAMAAAEEHIGLASNGFAVEAPPTESANLVVDLNTAGALGVGGSFAGDTFVGVNKLAGGKGDDTFTGNINSNRLDGRDGDDTLNGGAGDDTLVGGAGSDTLVGGADDDLLIGGAGADDLVGGADSTGTMSMGDTASYVNDDAGVTVTLGDVAPPSPPISDNFFGTSERGSHRVHETDGPVGTVHGTGIGGEAAGDTLSSIENLIGGSKADIFYGNADGNKLEGRDGDDELYGFTGNDTLIGGAGADTLDGAGGDDVLEGGTGNDTFVVSAGADKITDFSIGDSLSFDSFTSVVNVSQLSFTGTDAGLLVEFSSAGTGAADSSITFLNLDISGRGMIELSSGLNFAPDVTSASTAAVGENSMEVFYTVSASDKNAGDDMSFTYSIVGGADEALFTIDSMSGKINFVSGVDFESPVGGSGDDSNFYDLSVGVSDGKDLSLAHAVMVGILDKNDNTPTIAGGATTIEENISLSFDLQAMDRDVGDTASSLNYTITAGDPDNLFSVSGGILSIAGGSLNFENPAEVGPHTLTITADDGVNTSSPVVVEVTVTDVEPEVENMAPVFSLGVSSSQSFTEGVATNFTISASDDGLPASGSLVYSLAAGFDSAFSIDGSGKVSVDGSLDYEVEGDRSHVLHVLANDGDLTSTHTVTVSLLDGNDEMPTITGGATTIEENMDLSFDLQAMDRDVGDTTSSLNYTITAGDPDNLFSVSGGILSIAGGSLDFENSAEMGPHTLTITADDGVNTSSPVVVEVTVTDDPDDVDDGGGNMAPEFTGTLNTSAYAVSEGGSAETLFTVEASDDGGASNISFSLNGEPAGVSIGPSSGVVSAVGVDYDESTDAAGNEHVVTAVVSDGGGLSDTQTFTLAVTDDPADNVGGGNMAPKFTSTLNTSAYAVSEGGSAETLFTVEASDDGGPSNIMFSLNGAPAGVSIGSSSGVVSAVGVDYDESTDAAGNEYVVTAVVSDGGGLSDTQTFTLTVENDESDDPNEAPVFDSGLSASISFNVTENAVASETLFTATATDDKGPDNLLYSLTGDKAGFTVDEDTGVVSIPSGLDFETKIEHVITVVVTDSGDFGSQNVETDEHVFTVTVENDVNDDANVAPEFDSGLSASISFNVTENAVASETLFTATATDDKGPDNLLYSLTGDTFGISIGSSSGVVSIDEGGLDYERLPADAKQHVVTVVVTDRGNAIGSGVMTDEHVFTVTVENEASDDGNPYFTSEGSMFMVYEGETGAFYSVTASDSATAVDALTFTWGGDDSSLFTVDSSSGEVSFVSGVVVDDGEYDLEIIVTDGEMNAATQNLSVNYRSLSDLSPPAGGIAASSMMGEAHTGSETNGYLVSAVAGETAHLSVDLSSVAVTGEGGSFKMDTFTDVEHLVGGSGEDIFTGDDDENRFWGESGKDDLVGGKGADSLFGGAGNDILEGGVGADVLHGGAGSDLVSYASSLDGVTLALAEIERDANVAAVTVAGLRAELTAEGLLSAAAITALVTDASVAAENMRITEANTAAMAHNALFTSTVSIGEGGEAEGDRVIGVENIQGSDFADKLTGNLDNNKLHGGGGNDELYGGGGDDRLFGDGGADILDGGAGFDIVDYSPAVDSEGASVAVSDGITVTLAEAGGTATVSSVRGGDAYGDRLVSIESVIGAGGADVITGNNEANEFYGRAGDDTLSGADGKDYLFGNEGDDTLDGGAGNDYIHGGLGSDTLIGGSGTGVETTVTLSNQVDFLDGSFAFTFEDVVFEGQVVTRVDGKDTVTVAGSITYDESGKPIKTADSETISGTATVSESVVYRTVADTLIGSDGSDGVYVTGVDGITRFTATIDTGVDTVDYSDSSAAVRVRLDDDGDASNYVRVITFEPSTTLSVTVVDGMPVSDTTTVTEADAILLSFGTLSIVVNDAVGGDAQDDVLVGIEGLVGSAFDDVLIAGYGDNVLEGGAGGDYLDGGGDDINVDPDPDNQITVLVLDDNGNPETDDDGNLTNEMEVIPAILDSSVYYSDTAVYSSDMAGVTITLDGLGNSSVETVTITSIDGLSETVVLNASVYGGDADVIGDSEADGDTLVGIENLTGGSGDDFFITASSRVSNVLVGNGGDDVLISGAGNDRLTGGADDDVLIGGAGYDVLSGGEGNDTVSYFGDSAGVTVTLDVNGDASASGVATSTTAINNVDTANTFEYVVPRSDAMGFTTSVTVMDDGAGVTTSATATVAIGDELSGIENLVGGSGDDVLVGNAEDNIIEGGSGDDTLTGGDGAGVDTLSFAGSVSGVTYSLSSQGSAVAIGSGLGSDTISGFENLRGGAGADVLTGDANMNVIDGGAGNDVLVYSGGIDTYNGGSGIDIVDFSGVSGILAVILATSESSMGSVAGMGGVAGNIAYDVEGIIGGDTMDILTGNALANILDGGAGNDTLTGGAGADTFVASVGMDTIMDYEMGIDSLSFENFDLDSVTISSTGGNLSVSFVDGMNSGVVIFSGISATTGDAASIYASMVSDRVIYASRELFATSGVDTLAGGLGIDSVSYEDADSGVVVTLDISGDASGGSVSGGFATGDTLTSIESLVGSNFGDVFVVGAGASAQGFRLSGGAGDDTLTGGSGVDTLLGGAGDDILGGSIGADILDGGSGIDTASYSADTVGVSVDLGLVGVSQVGGGLSAGDKLFGIENLVGGSGADELTGNFRDNILEGGIGSDTLSGGAGIDTASYVSDTTGVVITLDENGDATITTSGGSHADGDVLSGIENLTGGSGNDTFTGNIRDNLLDGGVGVDKLYGAGGNDTLNGGTEGDTLDGGSGNDRLDGGVGDDRLKGGIGDDTFYASGGMDTIMDFGTGSNRLDFSHIVGISEEGSLTIGNTNGKLTITYDADGSGPGMDSVIVFDDLFASTADTAEDVFTASVRGNIDYGSPTPDFSGTAGDDTHTGGVNDEVLNGLAGDDILYGGGGDDILIGGAGADKLYGGVGDDTAFYADDVAGITAVLAESNDAVPLAVIAGNFKGHREFTAEEIAAQNVVRATAVLNNMTIGVDDDAESGRSIIFGLGDARGDELYFIENITGGSGDDVLTGNSGNNVLKGGSGDDVLRGFGGRDRLSGGDGDDILEGGDGDDVILAGRGNDTVVLTRGYDIISFGAGYDTLDLSLATAGISENYLEVLNQSTTNTVALGFDLAFIDSFTRSALFFLDGDVAYDEESSIDMVNIGLGAYRFDDIRNVDRVIGTNYGDTISGTDASNRFEGGRGDDRLNGMGGDDILDGGLGDDTLDGGDGIDLADYSDATGAITFTLEADGSGSVFALGLGSDTLIEIEGLIGSIYDDEFTGNTSDNYFIGGRGRDTIDGGFGSDTASYEGDIAGVTVTLDVDGNASGASQISGGQAEGDILMGIENLIGGSGDDEFTGNASNNFFIGGGGADKFNGGAGSDTTSYEADTAGVTIVLDSNGDGVGSGGLAIGNILMGIDGLIGGSGDDMLISGSSMGGTFRGNDGDDTITAGDGADIIDGGSGDDIIKGGGGDDTITVSDDGVNIIEGGDGADMITGRASYKSHVTVSYESDTAGVTVTLDLNGGASGSLQISGGHAEGDVLVSIENLTGGDGADTLIGSGSSNVLRGNDGADTLSGEAGDDRLDGGGGDDELTGGTGFNRFVVSSGTDTIMDFTSTNDDLLFDNYDHITNQAAASFTATVSDGKLLLTFDSDGASGSERGSIIFDDIEPTDDANAMTLFMENILPHIDYGV